MPLAPSYTSAEGPRSPSASRSRDLRATFGVDGTQSGDNDAAASDGPPSYDSASISPSGQAVPQTTAADIFFDAGDAMHEEPVQLRRNLTRDPLGAIGPRHEEGDDDDDEDDEETTALAPSSSRTVSNQRPTDSSAGYNFENASYFSANGTASRSRSRSASFVGDNQQGPLGGSNHEGSNRSALGETMTDAVGAPDAHGSNATGLARTRVLLGRFGRFVGMRLPGANYSSLASDDSTSGRGPSSGVTRSRRIMGGGLQQDGVFANLNAKPEGRRRRQRNGNGNPDDRGEDDDLEDEVLPPTYEVAAADAAPGYWETTIAPGGLGWTPGGGHVGDVEDLILEGLPVGNFFGFAWNLLVSMCFQFVGFLLTYLLHTTHAARCGSRAGLGITLIQYGFYLRTRALQLADDTTGQNGGGGEGDYGGAPGRSEAHTVELFGGAIVYSGPAQTAQAARGWILGGPTASMSSSAASPSATDSNSMPAVMASEADNMPGSGMDPNSTASSEWLAYTLMILGWFILLSSLLSYWRIHRWARALVAASRREQESQRAAENGGEAPVVSEEAAPVGFLHRFRAAMRARHEARAAARHSGTGEDWVIFPGAITGSRGLSSAASASAAISVWGAPPRQGTLPFTIDDGDETGERSGEGHLSPEEQRLLRDIQRGGLM
ncbi:unnamed protein product [Parajaminaea phylloscopi]